MAKKKKRTVRNPFVIPAKQRKAGPMTSIKRPKKDAWKTEYDC